MSGLGKPRRLLDQLLELGIRVECRGDRLRLWPAAAVSPELLEQLMIHKRALLAMLRRRSSRDSAAVSCTFCDRRSWVDEPPRDGRIRTHCGKCGRFIGYRPAGR